MGHDSPAGAKGAAGYFNWTMILLTNKWGVDLKAVDQSILNFFLSDICLPYQAIDMLPASGQRDVYRSISLQDSEQYIVKAAYGNKYSFARLERENKILNKLNSPYFPEVIFNTFVANDILRRYYDNLITGEKYLNRYYPKLKNVYKAEINAFNANLIKPFYLTIEKYVMNKPWEGFVESTDELSLCKFIRHCFVGLDLLWTNKIVHRDLKPENILINPSNIPVIIDFGIAKSFNNGTINLTPEFFPNPHTRRYASPEQLSDNKGAINYKTDQYSMGLIAYQIMCGGHPFGDIDNVGYVELVTNMMDFNYIPIAAAGGVCCSAFEEFIQKLLKPHPHQRYRTTHNIFQALDKIQGELK